MYSKIRQRLEPPGLELIGSPLCSAGHHVARRDLQVEEGKRSHEALTARPCVVGSPLTYLAYGPEMVDPDRSIDQDHDYAVRRRGIARKRFSVPPRSARRFALSSVIKASSPMWTREVFSFTPVSLDALFSVPSSILRVVLMHIDMHSWCIYVKCLFRANA